MIVKVLSVEQFKKSNWNRTSVRITHHASVALHTGSLFKTNFTYLHNTV